MTTDTPFRFLFRFLRGSILIAMFSVFLSSAAILLGVGLIGTSSYLISYAALQPSIAVLGIPIVGVRFFGISKSLFRYMERLGSHEVNFRILGDLRLWIYRKIIPRVPYYKSSDRTGDLLSRAVEDVEVLEFFFIRVINPPLTALFTTLIVAIFLGGIHPQLVWIYLGLACGSILFILLISYLVIANTSKDFLDKQGNLRTSLVDYFDGLPDLLVNLVENKQFEEIRKSETIFNRSQMRSSWGNGFVNGLLLLFANATMLVMLVVGIGLVNNGEMSGLFLAVITLITLVSFDGIQPLNLAAQQLHLSRQAARRIIALTGEVPETSLNTKFDKPRPISLDHPPLQDGLELRNIQFKYDPSAGSILRDIHLSIPKGQKVAIVGPSGSGKTTLARLILKFWKPDSGEIYLDGKGYSDLTESEVRNQIGYSGPDPFFFNSSLRENLDLLHDNLNEEEINHVLGQVGLSDWLHSLPDGLETQIGERGLKMSEGERRRLDLARLLVLDRPIFILDEPFANQDIQSQQLLADLFQNSSPEKTIILITHRLIQLDRMDQIIVLNGGTIQESGSQAELVLTNGLFKLMWVQQNQIVFDRQD